MGKASKLDPKALVWEELGFLVYDHLRMEKDRLKLYFESMTETIDLNEIPGEFYLCNWGDDDGRESIR